MPSLQTSALSWPICVIDFEASSLDDDSYPIEAGLAIWLRPDATITVWSSLIRPTDRWRRRGHWSQKSSRVHGISKTDLDAGLSTLEVAQALNEMLWQGSVYCDGGPYDEYWLQTLFSAAGLAPHFNLLDWSGLLNCLPDAPLAQVQHLLAKSPPQHRAGSDAERMLRALATVLSPLL